MIFDYWREESKTTNKQNEREKQPKVNENTTLLRQT